MINTNNCITVYSIWSKTWNIYEQCFRLILIYSYNLSFVFECSSFIWYKWARITIDEYCQKKVDYLKPINNIIIDDSTIEIRISELLLASWSLSLTKNISIFVFLTNNKGLLYLCAFQPKSFATDHRI